MFLGCLVDAGWPPAELHNVVARLPLPSGSWQISTQEVRRSALRATLVHVSVTEGDTHRQLADIRAIVGAAELPEVVRGNALAVFARLAAAEAAVHGVTIDKVHFHEVGALDAIVDIVGVCAGLHALRIERLYAGPVPLGPGWVQSAHGPLPTPAPATLALLAGAKAPTRPAPGPGELLTPTGAALLCTLAEFGQPPLRLERVGSGAGRKEFAWPNIARLWLGAALDTASAPTEPSELVQMDTNLDDMNPELFGAVSERAFAAGALDVWLTPIQMKKGRPGVLLSVLCAAELAARLARLLLEETTTLGVRTFPIRRHTAARTFVTVATDYGPVTAKVKLLGGQAVGVKPEYEDCVRLAERMGVPVRLICDAAQAAAYRQIFGGERAAAPGAGS
jgi:hypothetical protein